MNLVGLPHLEQSDEVDCVSVAKASNGPGTTRW